MTFENYEAGQLFAVALNTGSWRGCQVLRVAGDFVEFVALTGEYDKKPDADTLAKAEPLREDKELASIGVLHAPPPWSFELVGKKDLVVSKDTQVRSYGAMTVFERWLYEPWRFFLEPRFAWGMERSEMAEVVIAKRISHVPPQTHWIRLEEVESGEPFHQDQGVDIRIERGVKPNWKALDVLENLHGVTYTGQDTSVIEYLREHSNISSLEWIGPVESLDLSALSITYLELQAPRLAELRLPPTVRRVTLADTETDLQIHHTHNGAKLGLTLQSPSNNDTRRVKGIAQLPEFTIRSSRHVECDVLATFEALQTLSLQNINRVSKMSQLAQLKQLGFVHFLNCLHVNASDMPEIKSWASEPWFELDGLRKKDVEALEPKLSGAQHFYVRNARSDEWIDEHLNNPFLEWLAEDEARCQQACYAYAEAESQLKHGMADEVVQKVMKVFVEQFNEMAEESPLTSTQQASVYAAFVELLEEQGELPTETWDQRFAAWANLS